MTNDAPDVVIIGAMKSATTTLHYLLEKHVDVCLSHPKEMDFFSRDDLWERGVRWYNDQFPGYVEGQRRLDSSPNYTKRHTWPASAERLASVRPDARLIFLVREPIARIKSHWVHSVSAGRDHRDLEQIAEDLQHHIVQTTRYHWQLEPFFDHFSTEQFLVLRFDDIVSRPAAALERVFTHCGLDQVEISEVNDVRNSSANKTRPTELARRLPGRRTRGLLRRVHPRLADRALTPPQLTPAAEQRLRSYLAPDLEALNATGLVDVTDWMDLGR